MAEHNNDGGAIIDCIEKLHFVVALFNYIQGALRVIGDDGVIGVIGDDGPTPCTADELRETDRSIADELYDKLDDLAGVINDVIGRTPKPIAPIAARDRRSTSPSRISPASQRRPMSKRRLGLPRRERDNYPTPFKAVEPLLPHLRPRTRFIEPCAGAGFLVEHLVRAGHMCVAHFDDDAETKHYRELGPGVIAITNPPPDRGPMHAIIENLSNQAPTWLLVDSDWLFTQQAVPYLPRIQDVVVIGRMRMIEGTKYAGFDNYCWIRFGRPCPSGQAQFRLFGQLAAGRSRKTTAVLPITLNRRAGAGGANTTHPPARRITRAGDG